MRKFAISHIPFWVRLGWNRVAFRKCEPTQIASSVLTVDYDSLRAQGVKVLMFDIDNTLGHHGCQRVMAEVAQFFTSRVFLGFRKGIASNNGKVRPLIEKDLAGCCYVQRPIFFIRKPQWLYFRVICWRLHVRPEQVAVIGDKLVNDVLGSVRAGMKGVLVNPVGRDLPFDEILRLREMEDEMLADLGLKRAG